MTLASCSTELVMQLRSILSLMSAQTRVLSMSLTDLGVQSIYLTDLSAGTILALDILFCVWRRSLTRLTAPRTYQADLALVYDNQDSEAVAVLLHDFIYLLAGYPASLGPVPPSLGLPDFTRNICNVIIPARDTFSPLDA